MAVTVSRFWELLGESALLPVADQQRWTELARKGLSLAESADATPLAKWLVQQGSMTRYQARILLAGRHGPFFYGDYRIMGRIEKGGLSGCFEAVHTATEHPVLLSFFTGPMLLESYMVGHLAQLAQAANQCSQGQPYLARCYHLVDTGAHKFVAWEHLTGETLDTRLNAGRPLPINEVISIGRQAALAIAHLHSQGKCHGELTPRNILIDSQGMVRVIHFPLAPDPTAPPLAGLIGTLPADAPAPPAADYASPEAVRWGATSDPRGDLYSLGCILYHMLTGRVPFPGGDLQNKLHRHATETPPAVTSIVHAIPAVLDGMVQSLMSKGAAERDPDAAGLAAELLSLGKDYGPISQSTPAIKPTTPAYESWLRRLPKFEAAAPSAASAIPMPSASHGDVEILPDGMPRPRSPIAQMPVMQAAVSSVASQAVSQFPGMISPAIPQVIPQSGVPMAAGPVGPSIDFSVIPPVSQLRKGASRGEAPQAAAAKQGSSAAWWILGIAAAFVLGAVALLFALNRGNRDKGAKDVAGSIEQDAGSASGKKDNPDTNAKSEVGDSATRSGAEKKNSANNSEKSDVKTADSGAKGGNTEEAPRPSERIDNVAGVDQPIWASPTKGLPWQLRYLPPGPQLIVSFRMGELMQHPEWAKLIDPKVSGELALWITDVLPQACCTELDNLEHVTLAVYAISEQGPSVVLVAQVQEELLSSDVHSTIKDPKIEKVEGETLIAGSDWGAFVPERDQGKTIVSGTLPEIKEALAAGLDPPVLMREMEDLYQSTDGNHHFMVLAAPQFLMVEGKRALHGVGSRILNPFEEFLIGVSQPGESVTKTLASDAPQEHAPRGREDLTLPKAIMFSLHLDDDLFMEMRIRQGVSTRSVRDQALDWKERVAGLSRSARSYLKQVNLSPYSREVLWDLPERLRVLSEFTRVGTEEDQVVLRSYLPAVAMHNLVMSIRLSTMEVPGRTPPRTGTKTVNEEPQTVSALLDRKISLTFPSNSLEDALRLMADEVGVPIEILGTDLQEIGVTKNQRFGLDEREKPAKEILKAMLLKARPDGQVIFIVKAKSGEKDEMIWITTRAAAEKRKDTIPAIFAEPK